MLSGILLTYQLQSIATSLERQIAHGTSELVSTKGHFTRMLSSSGRPCWLLVPRFTHYPVIIIVVMIIIIIEFLAGLELNMKRKWVLNLTMILQPLPPEGWD